MKKHIRKSKKYDHYPDRDYWWYGFSNGASGYTEGDIIIFKLKDFENNKTGVFQIVFSGEWRNRILTSSRQPNNNIQTKIWKYKDSQDVKIYFGRVKDGEYRIQEYIELE